MSDGLRISIIGSRGIPARYGGFETLVEELAPRLVERGHRVTVYCRRGYTGDAPPESYRGVRLVSTPYVHVRSLETLSHELTSILHSFRERVDAYYFLGTRGSPWYLLVKPTRRHAVVHTDGLEWMRRKWGPTGRRYLRFSEGLAARVAADVLVTDAEAMRSYYQDTYGRESTCIPYGARVIDDPTPGSLERWGLASGAYDLVVCRLEPENNVDLIVRAHQRSGSDRELIVVGDGRYDSAYQHALRRLEGAGHVRFLGAVYDGVDDLYAGARCYLHGHEVGGMNPGLLRAMGAGACVLALDTPFNREALGKAGRLWRKDRGDLVEQIAWADASPDDVAQLGSVARARVAERFSWEAAADRHDRMLRGLG